MIITAALALAPYVLLLALLVFFINLIRKRGRVRLAFLALTLAALGCLTWYFFPVSLRVPEAEYYYYADIWEGTTLDAPSEELRIYDPARANSEGAAADAETLARLFKAIDGARLTRSLTRPAWPAATLYFAADPHLLFTGALETKTGDISYELRLPLGADGGSGFCSVAQFRNSDGRQITVNYTVHNSAALVEALRAIATELSPARES